MRRARSSCSAWGAGRDSRRKGPSATCISLRPRATRCSSWCATARSRWDGWRSSRSAPRSRRAAGWRRTRDGPGGVRQSARSHHARPRRAGRDARVGGGRNRRGGATDGRHQGPRRLGAGGEPRHAAAARHGGRGRGGEPVLAPPGRARGAAGGADPRGNAGGRGGGAGRQRGTRAARAPAGGGGGGMTTRAVETWTLEPLVKFVKEAGARLVLVMTSAGQVLAQHGFSRAVDVMSGAALGAAIMASTDEMARELRQPPFAALNHQGERHGIFLAALATGRGRLVALVVYDLDVSSLGLVQLFFEQLATDLQAASPNESVPKQVLAADFERQLSDSLNTLFGR